MKNNNFIFESRDYSELLHPKVDLAKKPAEIPHKRLEDIMKVELVTDKTAEEIKLIWLEYHKQKEVLIATIPVDQYDRQMERGKQHPMFIVPLPRSEGFEFFLFQFAANTVHFTPLLCYQVSCGLVPCTENLLTPDCIVVRFIRKMLPSV